MHKPRKVLRIGLSMGDIHGIGPELIIEAFSRQQLREMCTPIVYGSTRVLNVYRKMMNIERFSYNVVQHPDQAQPRKVSVIDCVDLPDRIEPGKPDQNSGMAAFQALDTATRDLKEGAIDALITLPIDKHFIQNENFQFPGHTEFLAEAFEAKDSLMFMVHDHLKIGVVTGHVPVKDISKELSIDKIVTKIRLMNESLKMDFNLEKPKIAVLGLNPHAGDNGLLGKEEKEKINKAIEKCTQDKMIVLGPYSADGFFGSGMFKKFDGIMAMYHDQGLIPFKLLAGFEGVNFTAGLPIVRTSPDHGPAFGLVGKNTANPDSLIHALYTAIDVFRRRGENQELVANSIWNKKSKQKLEQSPKDVVE